MPFLIFFLGCTASFVLTALNDAGVLVMTDETRLDLFALTLLTSVLAGFHDYAIHSRDKR